MAGLSVTPGEEPVGVRERAAKRALWDPFCAAHGIAATGVPLFEAEG